MPDFEDFDQYPQPAGAPRSIHDRMINPQDTDRENVVRQRLATLSFQELDRMIDHFAGILNHLAAQRDDLTVEKTRDKDGWTIRVNHSSDLAEPEPLMSKPNPLLANPNRQPTPAKTTIGSTRSGKTTGRIPAIPGTCVKCGAAHPHRRNKPEPGCAHCLRTCEPSTGQGTDDTHGDVNGGE